MKSAVKRSIIASATMTAAQKKKSNPITCVLCGAELPNIQGYQSHLRAQHSEKPLVASKSVAAPVVPELPAVTDPSLVAAVKESDDLLRKTDAEDLHDLNVQLMKARLKRKIAELESPASSVLEELPPDEYADDQGEDDDLTGVIEPLIEKAIAEYAEKLKGQKPQ